MQVWDVRYGTALTSTESTGYLSYLNHDGGLFLLGENSGLAARNNSLAGFVADAGGGAVAYTSTSVELQYVTDTFNGAQTVIGDSATGFYVPYAGTVANPGNGVFITTTQANGAGNGIGVAFGAGALTNAPTGRLLTYFDVNTFQTEFWADTPALRNLVDRMIGFVAGDFQADPSLPPAGSPAVIDESQPSFTLADAAAQGATITFDGGILELTGGSDPQNNIASTVVINDGGATIDNSGATGSFSGNVNGDGGMIVQGGGVLTLSGANTYQGGTVITEDATVKITQAAALGSAGVSLMGGTLEFGDDIGTTNNVQLFNGANALDTGAHHVTLSGVINGGGGFTKQGAGTLVLTGVNGYTGGTTVADGTLVGNTASLTGPVLNNANLVFDQTQDGAFGGTITGSGGFVKQGAGTLVLTGANSYAGGTTVTDGTLAGDTTSLTGPIVNNANLVFYQAQDGAFTSVITGSGALIKLGAGTLVLTGANDYTGGTTINDGALVANTANLSGPVLNNANLVFDQAQDGAFAGAVSGSGAFVKDGDGRLNLTGVNTYSGATTVEDGRLSVNGSIANSIVTVQDGAIIGGNGTVGGLIVRTNATAAPGNSIGQLTAATTVLFQVGSTYEVEADVDGSSDKLIASGAATIEGGTVKVLAANGAYNPRTTYTILEAASVTGKFVGVTSNLAFLTPTLGYSNTDIVLTLTRNDMTFAGAGVTFNQRSTGAAVDAAFGSTTAVYDQLVGMSAPQAQAAFDSLSGEIHGSALSVAAGNADNVRRTVLGRFDTTDGERSEIWGQALNTWNDLDGHANTGSVESKAPGFLVGGEMNMGEFRVGLAGGYTDADATLLARNSRADVKGAHAVFYAGAPLGAAKVRVGASYTAINLHTSRTATVGMISDRLTTRYDAHATQAFGEVGYGMTLAGAKIEPFVGVNALWLNNGGFVEQGGQTALEGAQRSRDTAWSTLGLKAEFTPSANLPISIQLKGGWQHALTDVATDSEVAFAAGGPAFVIQGAPLAKDAGVIDANVGWLLKNSAKLSVGYSGVIADQGQDHTAKITMSIPL